MQDITRRNALKKIGATAVAAPGVRDGKTEANRDRPGGRRRENMTREAEAEFLEPISSSTSLTRAQFARCNATDAYAVLTDGQRLSTINYYMPIRCSQARATHSG